MKTKTLFLALTLSVVFQAHAASPADDSWREYCTRLLQTVFPARALDSTPEEIRSKYNRLALGRGSAKLISGSAELIPRVEAPMTVEWLDKITLTAVENLLDRTLPLWREDDLWFFQTAREIKLYLPSGDHFVRFPADTYILMNKEFAVGCIILGTRAHVEMFE